MKKIDPGRAVSDTTRVEVHVKPTTYQPSKAELEEPIRLDATPDELARAVMQPVTVIHDR